MESNINSLLQSCNDVVTSPEKECCYSCGREVRARQMSRHLSHYPQCAARRPSRRLLSRRGKKSYQIPVPVDQIKDSNYSVASNVAENHSNRMHHPLLSRHSIFASTADGHPPSISEINVGSTDVPTSEKDTTTFQLQMMMYNVRNNHWHLGQPMLPMKTTTFQILPCWRNMRST